MEEVKKKKLSEVLESKGIYSVYWISKLEKLLLDKNSIEVEKILEDEIKYAELNKFIPDVINRWTETEVIGESEPIDVSELGGCPSAVPEPYHRFPIYAEVEHVTVTERGTYIPLIIKQLQRME